jgi:acyl-CoA synthetase (AMP-forming)/AMP-acid ligase II
MSGESSPELRRANVGGLLTEAARQHADRVAIRCDDQCLTYRELNARVNALAAGLTDLGLAAGDRVVIWLNNCPEFPEIMFACWKIGLAVVPMNARLTPEEVAFHVADCGAAALVYEDGYASGVARLEVPQKINVGGAGDVQYENLASRNGVDEQVRELSEEAPAWLFYTSGTTGRPKGAVLTHRNLIFVAVSWCADLHSIQPTDTVLHCAPLSHGAGFHALAALARGAQNVIHRRYDPARLCADVADLEVSAIWLVPTQIRMLLDSPALATADLSSLRSVVYGGSPMYLTDLVEAVERIGPVLCQIYAQGETPMTVSHLRPAEHRPDRPDQQVLSSAGVARTGVDVRILDTERGPVPVGGVGEILVRGPAVMSGYWQRPDATAESLRDGWLHTGDLGRIDERGYLYVLDRAKDFIITGGSNVYAREVEDALLRHPAVREAAVFGVPDRLWGEAVTAAVVGADIDADDIIAFCHRHLAGFKCPKRVYQYRELPKNAYGKVLKRTLRAECSTVDRTAS